MTAEEQRLADARAGNAAWRRWGPYVSERQWGTVREDYSADGSAWDYFPHDHARSRAYRWGEDGIAGLCDEGGRLCFALALWNGADPILKERLFGLTGNEGNHGEDVKEYAFYVDNVPSHAYMKYLYKYPQRAFPYADLVATNRRRGKHEAEYELLDTGIFDDDRYFDVAIEYAKVTPDDILVRISATNRGAQAATLEVLPTLWFRNEWSWGRGKPKPALSLITTADGAPLIEAEHAELGSYWLYCAPAQTLLFTENETNKQRLFNAPNASPYVKDGIDAYVVHGNTSAVNPQHCGTKAAARYVLDVAPGATSEVRLRLSNSATIPDPLGSAFDATFAQRKAEADAFYLRVTPFALSADMRNVQRQAFAGLLWNKQYYHFSVAHWLDGDPAGPPPPPERKTGRNSRWRNMSTGEVLSMPDKWEYPWFAAWDLAFHTIPLALIDPDFAKQQLLTITQGWYMNESGQIPAYEWAFGDVNPPVHGWAALRVYQIEQKTYGRADRAFLETMFHKLLVNFTWWINRENVDENNIFEGGFLGLDNIGIFDRTHMVPDGGTLEQADGTSWMAMYSLDLLTMSLELARTNPAYENIAGKFFDQFVRIADAINAIGPDGGPGLWNDAVGFYDDTIKFADGRVLPIPIDAISGLVPLYAVTTNAPGGAHLFPEYRQRFMWYTQKRAAELVGVANLDRISENGSILLAIASPDKLRRILQKVLDESQFLGPHGIRSVSRFHLLHPVAVDLGSATYALDYEPAESTTGMFGGNSNWRGPVWFPLNYLLIEALQRFHYFYGDALKVEYPTGSGRQANLWEISADLSRRLIAIFLKDDAGRRPLYGGIDRFQTDPHWRDLIQFHEYFNGDDGAGLGASNQTGWTALVAKLIQQYGEYTLAQNSPTLIEEGFTGNA